jgi:hypothetical protein
MATDFTLNIDETIGANDELRRNANAVVSDVVIGSYDITPEQFSDLLGSGSSPGYTPFSWMMSGVYSYQNAIVKVVLAAKSGAVPLVKAMEVQIDVPDVFDRGTAEIAVGGSIVSFNRFFHAAPEVVATLKSGTTIAQPKVILVTDESFTVELIDSSGASVSGTISWAARGY